jgi:cell division protein FtsB
LFKELSWPDFTSWDVVGWCVAILVGGWGALVGIGQYYWGDVVFFFAIALACAKWGHFTGIHTHNRHILVFLLGVAIALAIVSAMIMWSRKEQRAAILRDQQLAQLNLLPQLQEQVKKIPQLQNRVEELEGQVKTDTSGLNEKQDTITKLASTVLLQQRAIGSAELSLLRESENSIKSSAQYEFKTRLLDLARNVIELDMSNFVQIAALPTPSTHGLAAMNDPAWKVWNQQAEMAFHNSIAEFHMQYAPSVNDVVQQLHQRGWRSSDCDRALATSYTGPASSQFSYITGCAQDLRKAANDIH